LEIIFFSISNNRIIALEAATNLPFWSGAKNLRAASVAYDDEGRQPEFKQLIPQMTVEMFANMPFAEKYRKLAPNPAGFPELAKKLIRLEKEPMAWENDVRALRTPVLLIYGDTDGYTLELFVAMFRLLGGGVMGDTGKPLPPSRLAVMPATSHTAVITQTGLMLGSIEPFLKGETPKVLLG
jgi:pimeloyl-ACP methyl ester carboxylesterase